MVQDIDLTAHGLEGFSIRVGQGPKIGSVHLSVTAEAPKILVNHGGIQESIKSDRQIAVQAVPGRVEVIQVIFKTDPLC